MATETNIFNKLAGFNALIPQFDANSAVTPQYFVDTVESITTTANCSDSEKLLVLKSRIRGDALSQIINSVDLSSETDYKEFVKKFINYFAPSSSLATRQQQFSNCKMHNNEPVKLYAARVENATTKFFGEINPKLNTDVGKLYEQTKLSKFLEGLQPEYKKQTLMRDPQTIQEAIKFVQLLQANETQVNDSQINAIQSSHTNDDLRQLIEINAQRTHEIISTLSDEINKLKLRDRNYRPQNFYRPARHFTSNFPQETRVNNPSAGNGSFFRSGRSHYESSHNREIPPHPRTSQHQPNWPSRGRGSNPHPRAIRGHQHNSRTFANDYNRRSPSPHVRSRQVRFQPLNGRRG